MNFWNQYKWWIIGIGGGIIILAILFVIVYKKGKLWRPDDVKLPPDTQPGGATNFNPGPYTEAVWKDLDCIFCTHDAAPYEALMKLSNSQLVSVYNDWNKRYFNKNNETIIQAMNGDWSGWNLNWEHTLKDALLRFESLNLAREGKPVTRN